MELSSALKVLYFLFSEPYHALRIHECHDHMSLLRVLLQIHVHRYGDMSRHIVEDESGVAGPIDVIFQYTIRA